MDVLGYSFQSGNFWFASQLDEVVRLDSTGNVVSIPDLEGSMLVLDIGASARPDRGRLELARQAELAAMPRLATITAAGRVYRIDGARFERIRFADGRSLVAAPIGRPSN